MTATMTNEIQVQHSIRPDVGREFLAVNCPNGWDDVKRYTNKVLEYDGERYSWTGWNSDRNECYFVKPIGGEIKSAKIVK